MIAPGSSARGGSAGENSSASFRGCSPCVPPRPFSALTKASAVLLWRRANVCSSFTALASARTLGSGSSGRPLSGTCCSGIAITAITVGSWEGEGNLVGALVHGPSGPWPKARGTRDRQGPARQRHNRLLKRILQGSPTEKEDLALEGVLRAELELVAGEEATHLGGGGDLGPPAKILDRMPRSGFGMSEPRLSVTCHCA